MVPAFLRTLSARILVGFAVLIVTFGATTVWVVRYMDDLGSEIAVIRTGYLKLSLSAKDLSAQQTRLLQYLREELEGEGTPTAVRKRITGLRKARGTLVDSLEETLASMKDLPRGHGTLARTKIERVEQLRRSIDGLEADYSILLAAPPIEHSVWQPTQPADPATLEAAERARKRLVDAENTVNRVIGELSEKTRTDVEKIAKNLERNADRLRKFTLAMGIIAVLAGLLVTIWVSITMRPLARLRDASRRIARGEHGMRIEETGPVEVADLAREFNVMGQAIEERERELVRSERLAAVGKMAAMITHEVRNPLSSIALNTDLLGDELDKLGEADSAEARTLCRAITYEVDRLTAITEEYLAFARLPKPRLAAESVNQVVESLATFVREDLASRGVTLEVRPGTNVPRGMLDEAQIRQSLLNLVRNAAEALAGSGGGKVTLSTRTGAPGRVEIEVADDGPGIPADAQGRLFDAFFSTKVGGTGLGLALTSQIIRDHGGDIVVKSEPGYGARFIVSLPAASLES
jgi:signal transduction histidine kinase